MWDIESSCCRESLYFRTCDTRDMRITPVPLMLEQIQRICLCFVTDLCALIKRRFVPRSWQLCKRHISTSTVRGTHRCYGYITYIYLTENVGSVGAVRTATEDAVKFATPISPCTRHVRDSDLTSNQNGLRVTAAGGVDRSHLARMNARHVRSISRASRETVSS